VVGRVAGVWRGQVAGVVAVVVGGGKEGQGRGLQVGRVWLCEE